MGAVEICLVLTLPVASRRNIDSPVVSGVNDVCDVVRGLVDLENEGRVQRRKVGVVDIEVDFRRPVNAVA